MNIDQSVIPEQFIQSRYPALVLLAESIADTTTKRLSQTMHLPKPLSLCFALPFQLVFKGGKWFGGNARIGCDNFLRDVVLLGPLQVTSRF